MSTSAQVDGQYIDPSDILVVHTGPGANCSSIGSALDMLFVSAAAAGALLVALAAAFGKSPPRPGDRNKTSNPQGKPSESPTPPASQSPPQFQARAEAFGAWVRTGDGTLIALNQKGAKALGIDGAHLWKEQASSDSIPRPGLGSAPLEAHMAVTSRCGAGCPGCYLDATPQGESPPLQVLKNRLDALARASVFTVAFGGGEPLIRDDLPELARYARKLGLVPVLTTSGIGLSPERARGLRDFEQINISFDGLGEDYERVRGYSGAAIAERAMSCLSDARIPFGINTVLTRESFPALEPTLMRAQALGAREAQLLRYKPAGRANTTAYLQTRLSEEQVLSLWPALCHLAQRSSLRLRIDCALVPLLSAAPLDIQSLERFGVFGCEASRFLSAVRIDGSLAPCSFATASDTDALPAERAWPGRESPAQADAWSKNAFLEAFRHLPQHEPCTSCNLRHICRGGCRIVAGYFSSAPGPDPECPRVIAYSANTGQLATKAKHLHVTR